MMMPKTQSLQFKDLALFVNSFVK